MDDLLAIGTLLYDTDHTAGIFYMYFLSYSVSTPHWSGLFSLAPTQSLAQNRYLLLVTVTR
jgi:hypothetical protein